MDKTTYMLMDQILRQGELTQRKQLLDVYPRYQLFSLMLSIHSMLVDKERFELYDRINLAEP